MGPPPRGPLAGRMAGFDSAVPTVLAPPPWPALSVPWRAPPCFRYRLFSGGRRAPPLFVLSFGLCRPGRGCRRYRLFLPYRPAPPDQCFGVRRLVSGAVRSSPTVPTRPISAFVRSPFGGRWPSRIPIIVRSKFAQCSESCEGLPACVVPRRNR